LQFFGETLLIVSDFFFVGVDLLAVEVELLYPGREGFSLLGYGSLFFLEGLLVHF
jgi:hypothetical protein